MYGTCVFRICILPYLCMMQYLLHKLYMSKDITKLATFKSKKEAICTTHLWNPKKEGEKGQGVETNATGIVVSLTLGM